MLKVASTFARTGVIALGVLTGFGGMAMTAPLGPIDRPALPSSWTVLAGSDFNVGIGIGLPLFGGGGYYPGYYGGGYFPGYYGGYYPRRYYGGGYYPRRYYRDYYPRRYYGGGNAHVRSCYARYRSYRASDNTYQPYNGPRRQCL